MHISPDLQATLRRAFEDAQARRHEFVTLEHLLRALLDDPAASDVLDHVGADRERLRAELDAFLDEELERLPETDDDTKHEPQYTLGIQFVLQLAASHVQSAGKENINGANVLAALFREENSHAVYFLRRQNVTRFDVVRYISHGITKSGAVLRATQDATETAAECNTATSAGSDPLKMFCTNLNQRARDGKLDPLIGRSAELERTIRILSRRRKNNPVFVGDAGVGKTAIVEGLARAIVAGQVPPSLQDVTIYALDVGGLLAGTKYRGEFEERLTAIIDAVRDRPDRILFIDEIHNIIGAGAVSGSSLDASNMLKPALASGEVRLIGTTTFKEYRQIFERDHALSRRFQKIEVAEPSVEDTIAILEGLKSRYESFHGVTYSTAAVRAAAELADRYIRDRFLPDKAIDVLDEAGADLKLRQAEAIAAGRTPRVTARDVEAVVARMAKVPPKTVHRDDRERLKTLADDLKRVVFGQDEAIDQVVRAIQLARAGLGEPTRPIGSFLFAGPTGVGKTELAKQLAAHLGIGFKRFDMSEYMEKHAVSRLIGSPPGYVGYDQGGQLTEAVMREPHAVILLDEIEKAHEDIFQILLQIMDYATLTDSSGRKADFRQTIVIMTSNVGARELAANPVGFAAEPAVRERSRDAVAKAFSPEFRNRLTAVIQFNPLPEGIAERIVAKHVAELEARLAPQKIKLVLSDAARTWLAARGYDRHFGARPLARLIESEIAHRLSHEILFGALASGGTVHVDVKPDGDGLDFRFSNSKDPVTKLTPPAQVNA